MSYIPVKLREMVVDRAGGCCEYCRVSQEFSDAQFHIEHIITLKFNMIVRLIALFEHTCYF